MSDRSVPMKDLFILSPHYQFFWKSPSTPTIDDSRTQTQFLNKLPEITALFWIMKITATTLGETGGDWLSMTINLGYLVSTLIFIGLFIVAVGTQLASKKHHPFLYWTVII